MMAAMQGGSGTQRGLAALATYCLVTGPSFFVLLQACERCGMDNAYLGEVFLGLILSLMGIVFGLTWLVAARRGGRRGLAVGAVPGLAVAAVILSVGATRTLVPPALSLLELILLLAGAVATIVMSRTD
jgi:Na+/proline symporter